MTTYKPRDLLLARRANKHGAHYALRIILEARRAGLPISLAFALVAHESAHTFANIFGCDHGGMYCHQKVSRAAVQNMLRHVRAGGVSNGVGLTQLTSLNLLEKAERLGGAHVPANQLRVGFELLAYLVKKYGTFQGLMAFNAGEGGAKRGLGHEYATIVLAERDLWHRVLA